MELYDLLFITAKIFQTVKYCVISWFKKTCNITHFIYAISWTN